jgi:hypothetical protein
MKNTNLERNIKILKLAGIKNATKYEVEDIIGRELSPHEVNLLRKAGIISIKL